MHHMETCDGFYLLLYSSRCNNGCADSLQHGLWNHGIQQNVPIPSFNLQIPTSSKSSHRYKKFSFSSCVSFSFKSPKLWALKPFPPLCDPLVVSIGGRSCWYFFKNWGSADHKPNAFSLCRLLLGGSVSVLEPLHFITVAFQENTH